jgi:hypothetical protein
MGYKDKIQRLEQARSNDEIPFVTVLNNIPGGVAWVNNSTSPSDNQKEGDVFFRFKDRTIVHAFEMQVSRSHKNFSYGKQKVKRFLGVDGGPRWVVLGCLDEDGKTPFYCIIGAVTLNDLLESENHNIKLFDDKYYVIKPEALAFIKYKWLGNSLDEVVKEWWLSITAPN